MAASQARFLGLTARMNNIEYEGQQINQQRTALSNKTASYYSDLLGMAVPTCPSVEEFTKTVYTFNDGALTNQITSLIADATNPGKYKVSYIRSWTDDFSVVSAAPSIITEVTAGAEYKIGATTLRQLGKADGEKTVGTSIVLNGQTCPVTKAADGKYYATKTEEVKSMTPCSNTDKASFLYFLLTDHNESGEQVYLDADGSYYSLAEDGTKTTKTGVTEDDLIICMFDDTQTDPEKAVILVEKRADGNYYKESWSTTTSQVQLTDAQVESISYYANRESDPYLSTLSNDQYNNLLKEEQAYLKLLQDQHGNTDNYYVRYVQNSATGEYEAIFYNEQDVKGAIYSDETNNSQSFIAAYKVGSAGRTEEIKGLEGCEIEQDSTGRYINIKLGTDGKTYALSTNTVTDQDAYEDAMNQYEYDKAIYDQSIEEINAKIEIIQAEDKNLELRLKQLDTEHNAVSNEKDAVSKVIEKAVESGFKTFG